MRRANGKIQNKKKRQKSRVAGASLYTGAEMKACPYLYGVPFLEQTCVCMPAKSLQSCPDCVTLWAVARPAPLSVGFSRQEYWSGLLFPPPVDLSDPGIEP